MSVTPLLKAWVGSGSGSGSRLTPPPALSADNVEAELLHTFTKVYKFDTMLLLVRLAVLTAVTLTVPIVLFPVSTASSVSRGASSAGGRGNRLSFFRFNGL